MNKPNITIVDSPVLKEKCGSNASENSCSHESSDSEDSNDVTFVTMPDQQRATVERDWTCGNNDNNVIVTPMNDDDGTIGTLDNQDTSVVATGETNAVRSVENQENGAIGILKHQNSTNSIVGAEDVGATIEEDLLPVSVNTPSTVHKSLRINPFPEVILSNNDKLENWTMSESQSFVPDSIRNPNLSWNPTTISDQSNVQIQSNEYLTSTPAMSIMNRRPLRLELTNTNKNHAENQMTPVCSTEICVDEKLKIIFPTLKKGDSLKVKKPNEEWQYVQLISKGGKTTSVINKYHWNVLDEEGRLFGIFFDRLENFRLIERSPLQKIKKRMEPMQVGFLAENLGIEESVIYYEVARKRYQEPQIVEAMNIEIKNWIENDAFVEVVDIGQKFMSTRWVVTEKVNKEDHTDRTCKARLVVRGYEEMMLDENYDIATSSPTSEKRSQRVLFNIAVSESYILHTLDVKSAFLKSKNIERVLFVKPPKFARNPKTLWLLKKPVYGLKDSSRQWYKSLTERLIFLDCKQSTLDKAMFMWYNDGDLAGIIQIHVDDMIYGGSLEFHEKVISEIKKLFEISKESERKFCYVGVNISQHGDSIILDQNNFIADIVIPNFDKNSRVKDALLSKEETTKYRRLVGQLVWVVNQSRPDMNFAVLKCSTKNAKPTISDMLDLIRVANKIKQTEIKLSINNIGDIRKLVLYCFADGRYGVVNNKENSISGHAIFLSNGTNCSIVSWSCTKIKNVVTSAMEAETIALMKGLKETIYLNQLISEILTLDPEGIRLYIGSYSDSNSLVNTIHSETQSDDLQLRKHIAWLREKAANSHIHINWIPGRQQLADALTRENSNVQEKLIDAFGGILSSVDRSFKSVLPPSRSFNMTS